LRRVLGLGIAFGIFVVFSFKPELVLRTALDAFNEGFALTAIDVVVRFKLQAIQILTY